MKPKIAELEATIADLKDKLARSLADYSNLSKRVDRDKELLLALATTALTVKMIEVLDDLYLAQSHLHDPGLKLAIDKFLNAFKEVGVEEINPIGHSFNPNLMECVDTLEGEDNKIISVRKKGYRLNGHCLRPAQVVVGKKPNQGLINQTPTPDQQN